MAASIKLNARSEIIQPDEFQAAAAAPDRCNLIEERANSWPAVCAAASRWLRDKQQCSRSGAIETYIKVHTHARTIALTSKKNSNPARYIL